MKNNKYRSIGYMQTLKTERIPKHLIFFDTETWVKHIDKGHVEFPFRLGVLIYVELRKDLSIKHRIIHNFMSIHEFTDILQQYERKKRSIYVFAHNIGFDVRALQLPTTFNTMGMVSEPPIINERTFIWSVKQNSCSFVFLDTANFGVHSVDQLGKDLGFDKLSVDFDNVTDADLIVYCTRDVEILEKFVINYLTFIQDNNLGSFKRTLASQSLTAFRHRFMYNPPHIHCNELALSVERNGYHGGRVEIFRKENFDIPPYYYLDINSMYPHAMVSHDLPVELLGYTENVPLNYLSPRLSNFYVIADVTLDCDEPLYPLIKDHKLIFPIGKFRTTLYQPELEYAHTHGHIKQIHRCNVYKPGRLFDQYVDFFYHAKREYTEKGLSAYRLIAKLFQNSLYGKFGQLDPKREHIADIEDNGVWRLPIYNANTGEHFQQICWYGAVYNETKEGETSLSCPSIAGAITARARFYLYTLINKANKNNVYYCDTDSLIVNSEGYHNLSIYLNDLELGMLKLEHKSDHLKIYGCKDYEFGDEIKKKGVPQKAVMVEDNAFSYMQFEGMITWLNNGANTTPKAWNTTKRRISVYNKGIVNKDGSVSPFVMV